MKTRAMLSVFLFATLAGGCKGDPPTDIRSSTQEYEALSAKTTSGVANTIAPIVPAIRVINSSNHKPVADVVVEFIPVGGGDVEVTRAITNSDGIASAGKWRLSTRAGQSPLEVYTNGILRMTFVATVGADVPQTIITENSLDLAQLAGRGISMSFRILDQFTNPVPNATVTFSAEGGTVGTRETKTNAFGGVILSDWILGIGTNRLTVSAGGSTSRVIQAQGVDPAAFHYFRLAELRYGSSVYTPSGFGITEERVGLTEFDKCLCVKQEGYLFDEIQWNYPGSQLQSVVAHFLLDHEQVVAPNWFALRGVIRGDTLLFDREDPDFGIVGTWVYLPATQ